MKIKTFLHLLSIMKNKPIIKSGTDTPNKTTVDLYALKKKNVNSPVAAIKIPPISFFLNAMYTKINKSSHGVALGLFIKIPLNPPPYSSAPDNKANINQNMEISIRAVPKIYLKYFI